MVIHVRILWVQLNMLDGSIHILLRLFSYLNSNSLSLSPHPLTVIELMLGFYTAFKTNRSFVVYRLYNAVQMMVLEPSSLILIYAINKRKCVGFSCDVEKF